MNYDDLKACPGIIYIDDKQIPVQNVKKKCKKLDISVINKIDYYPDYTLSELLNTFKKQQNPTKIISSSPDSFLNSFKYQYRLSINSIICGKSLDDVKQILRWRNIEFDDRKMYKIYE